MLETQENRGLDPICTHRQAELDHFQVIYYSNRQTVCGRQARVRTRISVQRQAIKSEEGIDNVKNKSPKTQEITLGTQAHKVRHNNMTKTKGRHLNTQGSAG